MTTSDLLLPILAVGAAALVSAGLTWAIRPWLLQYALARPNARSSHRIPTPQGAGLAVIAATMAVAGVVSYSTMGTSTFPVVIFAASGFIAVVGFADDIKSMPVLPRLSLQVVALSAILFWSPNELRVVAGCPVWIERGLLLFAGLWFLNLVNFMDGLDWMTVAEVVPITAALILLGWVGELPMSATIVAASLCGAMIGFAPFNRPVATVFLGDVGSLPIGLLLGWCLLQLLYSQQFTAAFLLPLYYLADATLTLVRRLICREPFWAPHRSHFYQRAADNGFTVLRIVREVFALNLILALLAILSTQTHLALLKAICMLIGGCGVALTIYHFSRPPGTRASDQTGGNIRARRPGSRIAP